MPARARSPSNQEFILGFLCAIAIVATIAIFSSDPAKYLWSQEAAGWSQAIGTVLAILVTYRIASTQTRLASRKTREEEIKRAKVLALFVVPALKTIEADVDRAKSFCNAYQAIGLRDLKNIDFDQLSFRPLGSTDFILNNAHNLPDDLGGLITQLLGFHEIVSTNINLLIGRANKTGYIDPVPIRLMLPWLKPMETLINEIFEKIPELHDKNLSELIDKM